MSHTPGPWRLGNARDSVVSSHGTRNPDADAYYGGNLIAESINPRDRDLIATAPEILKLLLKFQAFATPDNSWSYPPGSQQELQEVIAKATGGGV